MQVVEAWCERHAIVSLSINSRIVKQGDCFLAYVNSLCDRRDYIDQAIERGAAAILYEAASAPAALADLSVPSLAVEGLVGQLSDIARCVYGSVSDELLVTAVTGTNGKSSIVYCLAQALNQVNQCSAMLSTFGNGFIDDLTLGDNTTPGVVDLYGLLAQYKKQGATALAMEASSHALAEGRMAGLSIDVGIFTQLSRDHLDFHGSMEAYAQAKRRLFEWPDLRCGIFNIDDATGLQWAKQYQLRYDVIATSCDAKVQWSGACVRLLDADLALGDSRLLIDTPWGKLNTTTQLLGEFNLSNLLAVIALLGWLDCSLAQIATLVPTLQPAPGRMQVFGDAMKVVVDYAHTPDALQKALQALRPYCQAKLWCVFGCGGDRDKGKRPTMAKVAEQYSDQVIVTDDNPRTESSDAILADIKVGFSSQAQYQVVADRKQAIERACQQAVAGDVILVAGKGHEPYQIIGDQRLPFDDCEVVQASL